MTKDVLVSVKGTRLMGDGDDTVEVITAGTYYEKNSRHYILYDEAVECLEDVTHNIVKIGEDKVEVIKRGNMFPAAERISGPAPAGTAC